MDKVSKIDNPYLEDFMCSRQPLQQAHRSKQLEKEKKISNNKLKEENEKAQELRGLNTDKTNENTASSEDLINKKSIDLNLPKIFRKYAQHSERILLKKNQNSNS